MSSLWGTQFCEHCGERIREGWYDPDAPPLTTEKIDEFKKLCISLGRSLARVRDEEIANALREEK